MRTSNFWLPLIAVSFFSSLSCAATIQSFGIAPNNPLPGDLVTAFFQIDSSTPVGAAGVWIDGIEQCQAFAEHGFYACAFSVPHGGRFNYELRFRDANGVLTTSTQQALSGGLRIVKFQPEVVQAGRSAIIFAKLDYFHPAAVPQPQGQIEIATLDGAQRCTIQLPQQTHCQILFNQAGRFPLRASYSGDASYPALTSAVSEISVANPKLDHVVYANEAPLGPIVPGNTRTGFFYNPPSVNTDGNWRLSRPSDTTDYNVGTAIPLFKWNANNQSFFGPSAVFSSAQNNSFATTTPRGEQTLYSTKGTIRALSALKNDLVYTELALAASDTNNRPDWYRRRTNSYNYEWLSKKADGTALPQGLPETVFGTTQVIFNADSIAFNSSENGIVADDQDGLPDTFIARAGQPTIRLPLPANRTSATRPIALNVGSDQLLFDTYLALTADDIDPNTDIYLYDLRTFQYRRIFNFIANGTVNTPFFAPDGAIVGRKPVNNSLIVRPSLGPSRELPLSSMAASLSLSGVSRLGQAMLFDARDSRLTVDLNTGVERLSFGRVQSDERLLQTQKLALNESGNRLLTFKPSELMTLNSDGTGRSAITAAEVQSIRLDDDANYVAFSSYEALIPEDTNQTKDVYEWDQRNNQLRRLSRRPDGMQTTQLSELLAYSRRAGIALVSMHSPDIPFANGALNLARIDLLSGAVIPVTGVPAISIQTYASALGASRNTRWAVMPSIDGIARVDTQSGATELLESRVDSDLDNVYVAAISDNGDKILVAGYTNNQNQIQVRLLNLTTNTASLVFQADQNDNDVSMRISADGRHALVAARQFFACDFTCPPSIPVPNKLFVFDLERGLVSEQIANVSQHSYDFSGDASVIAWAAFNTSGFDDHVETGDVRFRENPYFRRTSYTSIIRTLPSQPNLAQDFLVEAVVSHKEAGLAPSGIVRFDDGNGAQCDGELIAQGELAIARCRILPNAHGLYSKSLSAPASNSPLALSLTASYLGDRRYGASQTNRNTSVSKVTPTMRWLVANPSTVPEVSVGIELDALAGTAFTGNARITSNLGIPCFLSAVEIQAGKGCRFFIPYADSFAFNATLNDPIYTLGTGNSMYLTVGTTDNFFANGFEQWF